MTQDDDANASTGVTKTVSATLMTVNEMIETAFGDNERNVINFKLIQVILSVLAKQLRVLDRQVAVQLDPSVAVSSSTSIVVSELKLKTLANKKTKTPTSHYTQKHGNRKQISQKQPTERLSFDDRKTISAHMAVDTKFKPTSLQRLISSKSSIIELASYADTSSMKEQSHQGSSHHSHSIKKILSKGKIMLPVSENEDETSRTLQSLESETGVVNNKFLELLEKIEEQREQILRIINQRQNSKDEGVLSPSPIASLESAEYHYEKMLLVERLWEDVAEKRGIDHKRLLSIVTQDQFKDLADTVQSLQKRFESSLLYPALQVPENAELLKELRKGASLTDAMAALQLSIRLEAAEKGLEKLSSLITDLLQQKKEQQLSQIWVTPKDGSPRQSLREKSPRKGSPRKTSPRKASPRKESADETQMTDFEFDDVMSSPSSEDVVPHIPISGMDVKQELLLITKAQLKSALSKEQAVIIDTMLRCIKRIEKIATEAIKNTSDLEKRINISVNATHKILEIEKMVNHYAEQVNIIDTVLTSQISNYQEQLTQMQFDLESALENMAETLASQGVDPEIILELNTNFAYLQSELEKTAVFQMESMRAQKRFATSLESIRKEIEVVREIKSDRDEVEDALRDKAGLKELNGLLTMEYFVATLGDNEKRMNAFIQRMEHREVAWQKAIDELGNTFDNKVDICHVENLRHSVQENVNHMNQKIDKLLAILGEPIAAGVTKRLVYRDTSCISCSNPAHLAQEEVKVPRLPSVKSPVAGLVPDVKEDGDHSICIPGAKIPHPIDPRAEICTRYCGAAPKVSKRRNVQLKGLTHRALKQDFDSIEYDAVKAYKSGIRVPCIPCNRPEPKEASEAEDSFDRTILSSFPMDGAKSYTGDMRVTETMESSAAGLGLPVKQTPSAPSTGGSLMGVLDD